LLRLLDIAWMSCSKPMPNQQVPWRSWSGRDGSTLIDAVWWFSALV
jgi:hypothetical protein